ncbi:MAG: hypothetical protein KBT03_11465 [Bacteroidales bacterium]|nr:hypothetical protein [Candidatus Scybalousia scybalohippi]
MPNVKISELEEKQDITNNDYLIVDDGTDTKKIKGNKFANQSTTYTKTEVNTLLDKKAEKTALNETDRRLQNLYEITQGKDWNFETENIDENLHIIPSGVKAGNIDKIYGNTMAINQLVSYISHTSAKYGITINTNALLNYINCSGIMEDYGSGDKNFYGYVNSQQWKENHKYFISASDDLFVLYCYGVATSPTNTQKYILTATSNGNENILIRINENKWQVGQSINKNIYYNVIDLTAIENSLGITFSTIQDVEAYLTKLYGYIPSYIPYQENTLLDFNAEEIEVKGRNLFDKSNITSGYRLNEQTGGLYANASYFVSDYMEVKPNLQYYEKSINPYYTCGYDKDKNFVSAMQNAVLITIPSNVYYIRVCAPLTNLDICCFNIHDSQDNTYTPYVEPQSIPIPSSVLPLRQAGNVRDEIVDGKKIQRVGVVDLGTLTYARQETSGVYRFVAIVNGMAIPSSSDDRNKGILCSIYYPSSNTSFGAMSDKAMLRNNGSIAIRDDSYTNITDFKTAMNGVMLYYELATPIETTIDTPDTFKEYNMEGNGTLEGISDVPSSNTKYDIEYIVKLDESVGA